MAAIVKFDQPATAPEIDFPREERREIGAPERRTWVLYESAPAGLVAGIWECEVGRWRIQMDPTEHEYMVVLAGRCRLHATDGTLHRGRPGRGAGDPGRLRRLVRSAGDAAQALRDRRRARRRPSA